MAGADGASGERGRPPGAGETAVRREQRLRKHDQFVTVQREGESWGHPLLILRARRNDLGYSRYGFAVGKRVGKAVVRNRVKRLLREVVRQAPPQGSWDVVLIARGGAARADFGEIRAAVSALFARARLESRTGERSRPRSAAPGGEV